MIELNSDHIFKHRGAKKIETVILTPNLSRLRILKDKIFVRSSVTEEEKSIADLLK